MAPVVRHNEPIILFVTLGTQPRRPVFANAAFQAAFVRACDEADAWRVGRYVIMPDHLHLFCSPARVERVGIKRWSGYLKERITKRLKAIPVEGEARPMEGEPAASRIQPDGSAQRLD